MLTDVALKRAVLIREGGAALFSDYWTHKLKNSHSRELELFM